MTWTKEQEEFLASRKEAALKIDPETAEATWEYGSVRDPYYLFDHRDDWGEDNVGRNYFVRSPGSDVWVLEGDLPEKVRAALWERLARSPPTGDADDSTETVKPLGQRVRRAMIRALCFVLVSAVIIRVELTLAWRRLTRLWR